MTHCVVPEETGAEFLSALCFERDGHPPDAVEPPLPPVGLALVDLSEAELVARAGRHDSAAATELQWRCYPRVASLLGDRLGSRANAEVLVPALMEALRLALPSFPPHSDFSRWLAAFVANAPLE
jgi:hypothetical protein